MRHDVWAGFASQCLGDGGWRVTCGGSTVVQVMAVDGARAISMYRQLWVAGQGAL